MNPTAPIFGDHPVLSQAETQYIAAQSGIRIRLAIWRGGERGTVHIFNGRTEYIEKYSEFIANLTARGFCVTAHDWRGQGLSTRNDRHPKRCHIGDFSEFQHDAHAVIEACKDLPKPRHLFCHSMGGAIGLRYLMSSDWFQSAAFSAPMWGIYVPKPVRPFAGVLTKWVKNNDREWSCVIGTDERPYESYAPFRRNLLTTDKLRFQQMKERLEVFPELGLGGPTYHWYFAAKQEMESLFDAPKPKLPVLVFLGDKEKVVESKAIEKICARESNFRLVHLNGCKHECYIERDDVRQLFWSHLDSFWLTN